MLVARGRARLPADVAQLIDPARPLPDGVRFFEKRVTVRELINPVNGAVACVVGGVLCFVWGVNLVLGRGVDPPVGRETATAVAFGMVLAGGIGACGMIATFVRRYVRRSDQRAGRSTRKGVYLTPSVLVVAAGWTVTVIPRSHYRGTNGPFLTYQQGDRLKHLAVPEPLASAEGDAFGSALHAWSAAR